jgi:xanthine dehydrogenase YagR molybdenum-binding subunit
MSTEAIGKPFARVDGRAKVTGGARYAAEFNQPNQAYAVIVAAAVGLGRITSIDAAVATRQPGVLAVISHLNAPRLAYGPHKSGIDPAAGERLHVLQDDQVRFYGQPIAIVVADTLDHAERAAADLLVEYAGQRPVTDPKDDAAQPVTPEGGRAEADKSRGDADGALAAAEVTVDVSYDIARENHMPMEPHATVAAWDGDRLTLWSKSQFVVNEQAEIAAIFGLPRENVQVVCPFVGGAFGTSLRTWSHVTLAAIAARHVGRPMKLVLNRRQMFYTTGHRPRTLQRVALGATKDGKLTSVIHEGTGETSRYEQFVEALTAPTSFMVSCPNVRTAYRLMPLDIGTPTYMRGPGEASGIFATESALDELSYKLRIDPIELRRRNEPALDEGENRPFSSRSLMQCYALGAERFGWAARNPQSRSMDDGRLLIGLGCASATYPAMFFSASARARILADGSAEVESAASDMGPGTYTSIRRSRPKRWACPWRKCASASAARTFPRPRRMAVPTPWRPSDRRCVPPASLSRRSWRSTPSRTSAPRHSVGMSMPSSGTRDACAVRATHRPGSPMPRSSPALAVSQSRPAPPPPEIPRRRSNIPSMPSARCSPRCRSIPTSALPAFAGSSASTARGGSSTRASHAASASAG